MLILAFTFEDGADSAPVEKAALMQVLKHGGEEGPLYPQYHLRG